MKLKKFFQKIGFIEKDKVNNVNQLRKQIQSDLKIAKKNLYE